jgi:predicted  nucleic acid-binding Zn-ribbon protein
MSVETNIAEQLTKLWDLQQVDSQLDEIQILKGELPIEVADLEDEVAGLETRIGKLEASLKEMEVGIAKHQHDGKEAEANILRYERQLEGVKNNREYEALTKEIELARLDIQLSEKRANDLKVQLTARKDGLTVAEAKLAAKQTELQNKKVELDEIIQKTEAEEKKLRAASDKARVGIEQRLLNAYDKIRKTYRNGLSVITVERDSCGGCFNRVPPQVQLEVGLHKKVMACEHCGRILVDHSIAYKGAQVSA